MKRILFMFISIFLCIATSIDVKANSLDYINGAKSGILMEQSTGKVLYEKDIHNKLSPASMTKIMTLLLIYDSMDNNLFNKNTILVTSEYAASMGGSQVYLKVGEKITVDEAIKCICVASANDCAVLLAEKIAGSEDAFVKLMNERSKKLGCLNTNFSDCTGLTEENHYTTAYDLALISKELLTKYTDVLSYTTIKEDHIRKDTENPFWLVNTNKMIGRVEGLNGLKTGYTSFSGYCITLSMTKNNMSLISVVFGYENSNLRNVESLELLNYGFSTYKLDLIAKKDTILEVKNHILYKNQFSIIIKNDIYYLCKITDKNEYKISHSYNILDNKGNLSVALNNESIISEDIFCKEEPLRKNIFEVMISVLKECYC